MKLNGWKVGWAAQIIVMGEQSKVRHTVLFCTMTYVLPINLYTEEQCHKKGKKEGEKDIAQLYS